MTPRRWLWVAVAAAAGLRLACVHSWHVPAGDGLQYYALSQELHAHGRFAFASGAPLTYTRMPGYPLFLAWLAVCAAPLGLAAHLVRATLANVFLDAGTVLLVFLILRDRFGWRAGFAGLAAAAVCPMLVLLCCYGLSETLATFLGVLELYLALVAAARIGTANGWRWAAATGVVAGLGQLVRADAITVAPAVALALWWAEAPLAHRARALALCAVAAAVVFAPWPLRNLARFGHAHASSTFWRAQNGEPLPESPVAWERTWGSGTPGESYLDLVFVMGIPADVNRPGIVLPAMYDSPEERRRLVALFERYNREKWTPAVVEEFAAMARERTARDPWRTWVGLPLRRVVKLWSPVPEWELPMRVRWLGLPERRPVFGYYDLGLFALAAVGAIGLALAGRRERQLAAMLVLCLVARSAIFGFTAPIGVTERYLVEGFPFLLVLAGYGAAVALPRWLVRRRRAA